MYIYINSNKRYLRISKNLLVILNKINDLLVSRIL
jgi:hypothetical protein